MKTVRGGGEQEALGRRMAHLLPIPLGLHNHLPGSYFSLIQPLTRREKERVCVELDKKIPKLSRSHKKKKGC